MIIETINDSYAKALARIAELEAERGQSVQIIGKTVSDLCARIAEIEAERDLVQAACNDISDQLRDVTVREKALQAERDRLKAALRVAGIRIASLEEADEARLTAEQPPVPPDREKLIASINQAVDDAHGQLPLIDLAALFETLLREAAAALCSPADGWREGAEAMREACAATAIGYPWSGIGKTIGLNIAAAIRAMPITSPPAEETKT